MRNKILVLCAFLVAMLFIYAATSKLIDLNRFRYDMNNQPFPHWLSHAAVWAVPGTEILAVVLLLFDRTRLAGFWLAWCLLFMFTLYTALILGNAFHKTPCTCGGFINRLNWHQHLYFNLFFLFIASAGVILQCQEALIKIFHAPENRTHRKPVKKSR